MVKILNSCGISTGFENDSINCFKSSGQAVASAAAATVASKRVKHHNKWRERETTDSRAMKLTWEEDKESLVEILYLRGKVIY